ncbi:unnamed protein product, partial [Phaeothamnion confervicola]
GICGSAAKTCANDCGSRGNCTYIDASGTTLTEGECTIDRLLCYAVCSCNAGFNGSACQYTTIEFDDVIAVRQASVLALVQADVDVTLETMSQRATSLEEILMYPEDIEDAFVVAQAVELAVNITTASLSIGLATTTGKE